MMTLNVLFLSAEAEPFIKVGGLGDVAGALPKAIHNLSQSDQLSERVDIRLVIPYHFAIKQKGFKTRLIGRFNVPHKKGQTECQVYECQQEGLTVYLLDGNPIDEKSPIYSLDPVLDGYKFVFFSMAALWLADFLAWPVDIIQANDWHTACSIAAQKTQKISRYVDSAKTILSLHNLPYMGFGIQEAMTAYGIEASTNPILPKWARQSPLPLGLLHADRIIAVSPHYAQEILTPEFGCGLEDFLKTREKSLTGILNGLDVQVWDPSSDPNIFQHFDRTSLTARKKNKQHLQQRFGLKADSDMPLLTLVSRMDHQKGIDIALRGLKQCLDEPWQAILLGTGNPDIENTAIALEKAHPERIKSVIAFDGNLAHQLYAGADIFLMPSRYEPCGLSQMIAMRYGCIPVARATGGLVDTITHISHTVNGGTGFLFKDPYPSRLARAVKRAIHVYQKAEVWQKVQKNGMQMNFSWDASAKKYINEYHHLISQS